MDNHKELFEGLLKADGIDPVNVTKSERILFRQMLQKEKRRMNRLVWPLIGIMWIFAVAMMGLCASEKILEALHIPFVVVGLVIVTAMWIVVIRYAIRHNRTIKESGRKVRQIEQLIYGRPRGLILIGKKEGKRFICWPRIIMFTIGLWLLVSLGGAGTYYLLSRQWIYLTSPVLHAFFCTATTLSLVLFVLYDGLRTPLEELTEIKAESEQPRPAPGLGIGRIIMKSHITKFAAVAAVIVVVLGGINFWPVGPDRQDWWTGPATAWGQEITEAIRTVQGVSCRERTVTVMPDGSQHKSDTWNILYFSRDSYRRDIYDGQTLREIQWYVPDGDTMLQYSVRFDLKSHFVERHQGSFGVQDPIDRLRFYAQFLDSAEQLLGTKKIEKITCVGFEIKASKYGDNPETWVDHIWLSTETRLPVMIEQYGRPVTNHPQMSFTIIQDEFNCHDELPADAFEPVIPDNYIFGHPDDITSNKEAEN